MPERTYELTFALALSAGRINTQRSFVVLDGVKGALSPVIDEHFFKAIFEREDEAEFYHGLHADRVKFAMRSGGKRQALNDFLGEAGA